MKGQTVTGKLLNYFFLTSRLTVCFIIRRRRPWVGRDRRSQGGDLRLKPSDDAMAFRIDGALPRQFRFPIAQLRFDRR